MPDNTPLNLSHGLLRQRAEALLQATPDEVRAMPPGDVQKLVHELHVHQIELELQNEELLRSQVELAFVRDQYADLYQFAPIGYVTLNRQGKILEANLRAATMLRVERNTLVQSSFSKFVAHDSQDDFHHHRQAVFASEESVVGVADGVDEHAESPSSASLGTKHVIQLHMTRNDGTSFFARLESVTNGLADSLLCRTAFVDVTEEHLVKESLRRLNINLGSSLADRTMELQQSVDRINLLAQAIAQLNEGVIITSGGQDWSTSQIVFVNAALHAMTGFTADELNGRTPQVIYCSDQNTHLLDRINQDLTTSDTSAFESINRRKDGTNYFTESSVSTMRNSQGQCTHHIAIVRDITARKHSEDSLKKSEEQLRAIVNTAAEAIITINHQGQIVSINPAGEQMFGYEPSELIGQSIGVLMPAPDAQACASYISRYLSTGEAHVIGVGRDVVGRCKDGSTFPAHLSVSEVDHLGLFTGIIRDTTRFRQLQQHLLTIASEEQRRIGQDLHDGVGQHVLASSLTAHTLAESLKSGSASDQEITLAVRLESNLKTVLTEIRGLARGLVPVDIEPDGLMLALAELSHDVGELHHSICTFRCDSPVRVTDHETATHLYRIAQEAISNAIKHGRAHVICIQLRVEDDSVILTIQDDGIGLPTESKRNSGIGIRTMHYRANLMGARLTLDSDQQNGTLITCAVPGGASHD